MTITNVPSQTPVQISPERILEEKFKSLGGEATLGQPTNKGDGIWTFGGSSCICFDQNLNAAFQVKGAIYEKWAALGGAAFGLPCTDEETAPDGVGKYNHFADNASSIYWSPNTGAHEVHGAIREKWSELGWEKDLGYPTTDESPTSDGVARFNTFSNDATIYWTPSTGAHVVRGAIHKKWLESGAGPTLGYPVTDELQAADSGRHSDFANGALIYWSPKTPACVVLGAIATKWRELGAEKSYLGYPVTDEVDFAEGGRTSGFQGGGIYFWGDTGAIALAGVVVNYNGLHCFGESDFHRFSAHDAPYAIFGVSGPNGTATIRTQIFDGVDGGQSVRDGLELYRGQPWGVTISTALMQHNEGDPDKYKDIVAQAVDKAHQAAVAALPAVPVFGPALAVAAEVILTKYGPDITNVINGLIDSGDDPLGDDQTVLSAKQLVTMAVAKDMDLNADPKSIIKYQVESNLMSRRGASYKVYFDVHPA